MINGVNCLFKCFEYRQHEYSGPHHWLRAFWILGSLRSRSHLQHIWWVKSFFCMDLPRNKTSLCSLLPFSPWQILVCLDVCSPSTDCHDIQPLLLWVISVEWLSPQSIVRFWLGPILIPSLLEEILISPGVLHWEHLWIAALNSTYC